MTFNRACMSAWRQARRREGMIIYRRRIFHHTDRQTLCSVYHCPNYDFGHGSLLSFQPPRMPTAILSTTSFTLYFALTCSATSPSHAGARSVSPTSTIPDTSSTLFTVAPFTTECRKERGRIRGAEGKRRRRGGQCIGGSVWCRGGRGTSWMRQQRAWRSACGGVRRKQGHHPFLPVHPARR